MDAHEIGRTIAAARKRLELTQAEAAERAGVSRQTLSFVETGRNPEVGFATLGRILDAVELRVALTPAPPRLPTRDELAAHRRTILG